jgi:hypothetical protein
LRLCLDNLVLKQKDALLTALGEQYIHPHELEQVLLEKGIMTEAEWDARLSKRYEDRARPPAFWVCQDPADKAALDAFFGTHSPQG